MTLGCSGANQQQFKCDDAAVAPLVPRIEAAVEAKDYATLAAIAAEVGADIYKCATEQAAAKAKAKAPAGSGSAGSGSAAGSAGSGSAVTK